MTVKDWIDVEGFPCVGGSVSYRDRRPEQDATVVKRLRAAGAIVIAKTAVRDDNELYGATRNPHDHARSPGGSSSGEAALVAAGASPLGIGSDSGGSIRGPAAWCGIAGFKPSAGRVSNTGHFPRIGALHDGRTQIGPLARNIDDLALALEVIAGFDGIDPGVIPVPLGSVADVVVAGLRVAWFTHDDPGHPSDAVAEHVELAVRALAGRANRRRRRGARAPRKRSTSPSATGTAANSADPKPTTCSGTGIASVRCQLEFAQTVDIVVSPKSPDVAPLVERVSLATSTRCRRVSPEHPRPQSRPGSTERFRSASSSSGDAGTTRPCSPPPA